MHANHNKITKYLNVAKGQLDGIKNMIETDQYCLDISNQLLATIALLKKTNQEILASHLRSCVKDATGEQAQEKLEEIITVLIRLN